MTKAKRTLSAQNSSKQKWGVLSPKYLSGQIIWLLVIALVGALLAAGFGPAIFGSGSSDLYETPAVWLKIIVEQDGLELTAKESSGTAVHWKYRLVDANDYCDEETFAVAPNNPSVHQSNQLAVPESAELQDSYRNRFVCFEATAEDASDSRGYYVASIDLGKPTVSIVKAQSYLLARADEDVSWRVRRIGSLIMGDGLRYQAGTICAKLFTGEHDDYYNMGEIAESDGRVSVADDGKNVSYCFEAEDEQGNLTYTHILPASWGMYIYQRQGKVRALSHIGTTGEVDWAVSGPAASRTCDASVFNPYNSAVKRYANNLRPYEYMVIAADQIGDGETHYYCFRAKDELGFKVYRSIKVEDLQGPNISIGIEDGRLKVTHSDEQLSNFLFIGPLLAGERCFDTAYTDEWGNVFANEAFRDRYGVGPDYKPDTPLGEGDTFCVYVQDRLGNITFEEFRIR